MPSEPSLLRLSNPNSLLKCQMLQSLSHQVRKLQNIEVSELRVTEESEQGFLYYHLQHRAQQLCFIPQCQS